MTFTDEPLASALVISLNGGASYSAPIPDNQGSATFTDLAPGMYPVWVKWASDECAVFIGDIEVAELPCGNICGNVHEIIGQPLSNVESKLYIDVNDNDMFDAGDILVETTYTDGDSGNYCFEDIPAGNML